MYLPVWDRCVSYDDVAVLSNCWILFGIWRILLVCGQALEMNRLWQFRDEIRFNVYFFPSCSPLWCDFNRSEFRKLLPHSSQVTCFCGKVRVRLQSLSTVLVTSADEWSDSSISSKVFSSLEKCSVHWHSAWATLYVSLTLSTSSASSSSSSLT